MKWIKVPDSYSSKVETVGISFRYKHTAWVLLPDSVWKNCAQSSWKNVPKHWKVLDSLQPKLALLSHAGTGMTNLFSFDWLGWTISWVLAGSCDRSLDAYQYKGLNMRCSWLPVGRQTILPLVVHKHSGPFRRVI